MVILQAEMINLAEELGNMGIEIYGVKTPLESFTHAFLASVSHASPQYGYHMKAHENPNKMVG